MQKLLCCAAAASLLAFSCAIAVAADPPQKKAAAKTTAAPAPKAPAKKAAAAPAPHKAATSAGNAHAKPGTAGKTAATRNGKKGPAHTTATASWRTRQLAPTADRYKDIQAALASKGYLKPEDATGVWNQNSTDALKKFQTEQNLDSSGKINSLSLIALGLGPRRDTAAVKPPVVAQPPQSQNQN